VHLQSILFLTNELILSLPSIIKVLWSLNKYTLSTSSSLKFVKENSYNDASEFMYLFISPEDLVAKDNAIDGITKISECVDTLIVISNDKLRTIIGEKTPIKEAFKKADEVLQQAVRGITDIINDTADINLDFADIQTAMRGQGVAHIGIGMAKGDNKAEEAVRLAIESPLLETQITSAKHAIVNITGDISLNDVAIASEYIQSLTGDEVNIFSGANSDETMTDTCIVTVIATGLDANPIGNTPGRPAPASTQRRFISANTMAQNTYQQQMAQQQMTQQMAQPVHQYTQQVVQPVSQNTGAMPSLQPKVQPSSVRTNVTQTKLEIPKFLKKEQ